MEFDERLQRLAEQGEQVPARALLKTPQDIEGIKRSAEVNVGVLDLVAERIGAGVTTEQMYADVRERAIQSLREDSALDAYAQHAGLKLEAEDFYAIIPGDDIQDKARKRKQIELDGRLAQMEDYALKTKALKQVMENAMIKRRATDTEWLRYGDTSADVLNANKQFPDSFVSLG